MPSVSSPYPMTLQALRYLVAVADEQNFGRAAAVCNVGQSTLSTQLRKLEDGLGATLFDRSHRHAEPTPLGEKVIAQARIVLREAGTLSQLARSDEDPMASTLRLGMFPTLGPYLVPHLLPELRRSFPQLRLFLREDLTANLLASLHRGDIDAALLARPINATGLDGIDLFTEPFAVALPAGHPLAAREQVHERDLSSHCVLLLEEGHCLRDQALAICGSSSEGGPREEFQATSLETLRQMVAVGLGCTLLPALAVAAGSAVLEPGLVDIRPFAAPVPSRSIGMYWRAGCPRKQTFEQLSEYITRHLPACVTPAG